ncbi:hypothetical protein STRDD10_01721 [Streptococcus sp. DD10]|uniref:hypothetical protein n=1 Tax=Streptococcus sp. DD10 TaxID=1777878 RepID=UPI000799F643|nr:hypothetical protein [Streptococcus sp. DD10]KXT72835.1 hypothetical protein STRDD10_01721 [Streptococcus sp. DD10]
MKSNASKGCLYFFGGLFLLGLLIEYAIPLAIGCALIGGGYYLYRRLRYPLLRDQSLADQIELLKARIAQADGDIRQLETVLGKKGEGAYRTLAQQVLIELDAIHKEANRLKQYLQEGIYDRIDKKIRSTRASIKIQLERLDAPTSDSFFQRESSTLDPELSQTLDNISIDHETILKKIKTSKSSDQAELLAIHERDMERFQNILQGYLAIKASPKDFYNAEERMNQARAAIFQFDLDLDEVLRKLNEAEMHDFDVNLRIFDKKKPQDDF